MNKSLHSIGLCLTGFALAILAVGCNFTVYRFSSDNNSDPPPHKFEKTLEIAAPMAPSRTLSATSSNGNIDVVGTDTPHCTVTAHITAHAWSDEEAKTVADQVTVAIDQKDNETEIVVQKPDIKLKKHILVSVDLTLPKQSGLHLTTTNGNITSREVAGPVEIRTCNGNVTCHNLAHNINVRTLNGNINLSCSPDADSIDTVKARALNGVITFKPPRDYSAQVDASTLNGVVHSNIPLTVKGKTSRRHLKGMIGDGQGSLHLRSLNGVISIQ